MVANYHQSRLSPPLTSQFVKCPVTETLYFLIAGNVKANIGFISELNVREEQKVSWVGFEPIKHFAILFDHNSSTRLETLSSLLLYSYF
jgi:hypothetical protein